MKRFFPFVPLLLMVLFLCVHAEDGHAVVYDEYMKVADNLYEVTCDTYEYDYVLKDGRGNIECLAGCSAIKEGSYLGRNFDFVAGDAAEIVVKTTAKKDRYATVGMVGGMMWLDSAFMRSGLDEDAKKLIPLVLLDGINEKGLAIAINCVNAADVGGVTMHTNPGRKAVHQLCVIRYLLDHAASADEAVRMMKELDIVTTRDVMGLLGFGFEVHYLITDRNRTYVVEFDNTRPDGEKMIVMEGEAAMTNFYLHLSDPGKDIYSDNSMGIERYRKLVDNRHSVTSVDTMKALMQSVRYSNSNRQDGEYAPGGRFDNPYTCFSDHPVFGKDGINYANHKEHVSELLDEMKQDEALTAALLKDPELRNPTHLWVTSHNTVYDLENRTMNAAVFERFDRYYEYSFAASEK